MLGIYCPHNAPAACKLAAITLSTLGTRATYVSTGAWRTHLPRDGVTAETDSRKTHRLISVDLEATKRVASPTIQLLIELASIGRVYRPYEIRDTSASALATPSIRVAASGKKNYTLHSSQSDSGVNDQTVGNQEAAHQSAIG
jgi:hypothetical protein